MVVSGFKVVGALVVVLSDDSGFKVVGGLVVMLSGNVFLLLKSGIFFESVTFSTAGSVVFFASSKMQIGRIIHKFRLQFSRIFVTFNRNFYNRVFS